MIWFSIYWIAGIVFYIPVVLKACANTGIGKSWSWIALQVFVILALFFVWPLGLLLHLRWRRNKR